MGNPSNSQEKFNADVITADTAEKNMINMLQEKYRERSFMEENNWWYIALIVLGFVCQLINVATGFSKPAAYLGGIFNFGMVGTILSYSIALLIVVGIEYGARKNLTQLYERKFFGRKTGGIRIAVQMGLMAFIIALSYLGAPDAVKMMSGELVKEEVVLKSNAEIRSHYDGMIKAAEADAARFYAASSYLGKLDTKNQGRYNRKLEAVQKLREEYTAKLAEIDASNAETMINDGRDFHAKMLQKEETDALNGQIFGIIACISCILFWLSMYGKEKYEYLCALELAHGGQLDSERLRKVVSMTEDKEIKKTLQKTATTGGGGIKIFPNGSQNGALNENQSAPPYGRTQIGFHNRATTLSRPDTTSVTAVTQPSDDSLLVRPSEDAYRLSKADFSRYNSKLKNKQGAIPTIYHNMHRIFNGLIHNDSAVDDALRYSVKELGLQFMALHSEIINSEDYRDLDIDQTEIGQAKRRFDVLFTLVEHAKKPVAL